MAAETNYNFYFGMDCNGDYPGSHVKRLRVDDTAIIGGDTTIGGNLSVNGDIKCASFTEEKILTGDGTEEYPSHSFTAATGTGMYRTTDTKDVAFAKSGTKRLRVGDTSEFYTDLTVPTLTIPGTSSFAGTINCAGITASSGFDGAYVNAPLINSATMSGTTLNLTGTGTASRFVASGTTPLIFTSTSPTVTVTSATASSIEIRPQTTTAVTFSTSGTVFAVPLTAPSITTTSASIANCTNGDTYSTTMGASVFVATNCILTTVGCTSLGATNLTSTNSSTGFLTCSTLTTTAQSSLKALVTVPTAVSTGVNTTLTFDTITGTSADAYFLPGNQTLQFGNNGRYLMSLRVYWASNSVGSRTQVVQGGGGTQYAYSKSAACPDGVTVVQTADYGNFTTNTVTVIVHQTSGGSLNVDYAELKFFRIS